MLILLLLLIAACSSYGFDEKSYDYSMVLACSRYQAASFADLPGFTRGGYQRDHALITPENRVWASFPGWSQTLTAHLIAKAVPGGANFVMYLADLKPNASSALPAPGVERLVFVLDGALNISTPQPGGKRELHPDEFVYYPHDAPHSLTTSSGAGILVFERHYAIKGGKPTFQVGKVSQLPVLPVPGEVFVLRKLLPQTADFDFNIHIMDFRPGEYLNVKEVHYNQHGLLLLQGQGVYRLADRWYPVQAGDAIWMAPFVLQWYAALGTIDSRYILYKDTIVDPLFL
ncbi:hypothetical protein WJX72_009410 [[Myrmecia] bisecta]|uniref:Cupin 2 conserved barrel domain-containing protein n=1 Tax=[Myrmecia] bisecta TaxID=41462 RepID=A0AAW1PWJ4_9CHLO